MFPCRPTERQRNGRLSAPQNPYHSCIVSAAAGAGKTWQLSRRFLFLVGAHAAPHEILTITFTRKAAAEMRTRVIAAAAELATDREAQRAFDTAQCGYHEALPQAARLRVRPPRAAVQVSNVILSQSQKLNIATIDSVCSEWLASLAGQGFAAVPRPFKIVAAAEAAELRERSWQRLWRAVPAWAQQIVREEGTAAVRRNVMALSTRGNVSLRHLTVPAAPSWKTTAQRLAALSPAFAGCAAATTQAELSRCGVLTRKKINRRLLPPDIRKRLKAQLDELDRAFRTRRQADQLQHLNARGTTYFALWQRWREIYRALKKNQHMLDFQDLTTLVQELLARDAGLLFYLQQRIAHLLLDEFQDTSMPQWDIFRQLSTELLAGENCVAARQGLQATVFIVGDPKQSIYAFRGAEAKIMATASADLAKFTPHHYPLTVNYRSAAHLLQFFNVIFPALALPDFLPHRPAPGTQRVGDYGTVVLASLTTTEVSEEAAYVAQHIAQTLRGKPHLQARDVCILYRNGTHADVFRAALLGEGLNGVCYEEQGFFAASTSRDLSALCKWLALPQDQQALLTVLRSPLCAVPAPELLHTYAAQQDERRVYRSSHILQALAARYPHQVQALQELCKLRAKTTPCRLLLYALQRLDAWRAYRQHGDEFVGRQALQNIVRFIDLLAAAEREGCHTWGALHVRLATQAQHDGVGGAATPADAVTLMTIHKAKGLQFKYVILVQAQEKWPQRDNYWLKTNDRVIYSGKTTARPQESELDAIYAQHDKENAAESLRLLYVALTRAEHYLLICGRTPKRTSKDAGFLTRIVTAVKDSDLDWRGAAGDEGEIITLRSGAERESKAAFSNARLLARSLHSDVKGGVESCARVHRDSLSQEVRILLPHQRRGFGVESQEYSPAARVYGIYLHKALEQHVKRAAPLTGGYWDELAAELGEERASLRQKAERTLQTLLASSVWQELWCDALWSRAEMPIVCLAEGRLINGVIDLLICYPQQRLQLIDYKTGVRPDDLGVYAQQLKNYRHAVHKLYPDHTITTALLFTNTCHLVSCDAG